jgi:flagellin-like hook-associated protein FlgL
MAISLSQGLRNGVYALTDVNSAIDTANKRLATGKKVNSALDNARSYFAAQGLQKEGRDLNNLLDGLERGSKIIQKATNAIDSIRKLVESAQSLARSARQLADTDTNRNTYRDQIAELVTQASRLAFDSGYDGSKLLQTDATALPSVVLNTNTAVTGATNITLAPTDFRVDQATGILNLTVATTGLTVTTTAGSPQSVAGTTTWATAAGNALIDATVTQFANSLNTLQTRASTIATQSAVLDIRKEFIRGAARANNEYADYLTLADINEEGANLTSLQTKQQLAVQALSLAGRSDQAILRLF